MNELGVVAAAEFMRRIRSRTYIIATMLGVLSVVAVVVLPRVLHGALGGANHRLVLSGDPALTTAAASLLGDDLSVAARVPPLQARPTLALLNTYKAGGVALLERTPRGTLRVTVYARDPSMYHTTLARALGPLQLSLESGIPVDAVRKRLDVAVDVRDVGGRFADASEATAAKGIAYVFEFLLYLAILLNAQSILSSVAEEKTSRIAELLVASIDPSRLLAGKVLASTGTGLIQLAVWLAAGAFTGQAATGLFADNNAADASTLIGPVTLPPGEVLALIAFFLVGFVQYAVLYAAAASLINRTEDLGSVAAPLVLPVVLGFMFANFSLAAPSSGAALVGSQLPLLAPFVMFTRIAISEVPLWQIALSLAINIAAAIAFAILAGRVYRVGLLLYGRAPSLRQVLTTLRSSS
ncbi:MAG TPA: ABC transporter permease [Candidatus Acidoferrum sp.]|nr:ABC transporter permease [Candidatus Acidoferrum sp.]